MFTDQRKDKLARVYLERKTKILEWLKDYFNQNSQMINQNSSDLIELIEDGVVLCKLMNIYQPGAIERIIQPKPGRQNYQRIENINEFINHCYQLRVPVVFQTLDLFENKNPVRVVNCLYSFIKMVDATIEKRRLKRKKEFTVEELARANIELTVDRENNGEQLSTILTDSLLSSSSIKDNLFSDSTMGGPQHDVSSVDAGGMSTPMHGSVLLGGNNGNHSILSLPLRTPVSSSSLVPNTQQPPATSTTIQFQMSNVNSYESNSVSILNTSHQRTTVISSPLSRLFTPNVKNRIGNSSTTASSSVNSSPVSSINNIIESQISNFNNDIQTPPRPALTLDHLESNGNGVIASSNDPSTLPFDQMATSSTIKTASISSVPIKSVHSFSNYADDVKDSINRFQYNYHNNNRKLDYLNDKIERLQHQEEEEDIYDTETPYKLYRSNTSTGTNSKRNQQQQQQHNLFDKTTTKFNTTTTNNNFISTSTTKNQNISKTNYFLSFFIVILVSVILLFTIIAWFFFYTENNDKLSL